eukprot:gene388-6802_t
MQKILSGALKKKGIKNFYSTNKIYRDHRINIFEEIKNKKEKKKEEKQIFITLPNGKIVEGISDKTKPIDIIPQNLLNSIIICKNKETNSLIELFSTFKDSCSLEYIDFENDIGKKIFWHSSAHVLGNAIELYYENSFLDDGPALKNGFFYDFESNLKPSLNDFENMNELLNFNEKFEKYEISKEEAEKMFKYNHFKLQIIENISKKNENISIYKTGEFIDLCSGPHIYNTKMIKSFNFLNCNSINENVSRIYGISFPNKKLFKKWEEKNEEIKKRDHRNIGKQQELFLFFPESPGNPFFLPNGTKIFNRLLNLLRKEYKKRNYKEVITPQLFNKSLWEISGHWENYKEDMHLLNDNTTGLKPMNCPAHCLLFNSKLRSYKELPLKYADFSPLHRNENTGSLTGLTRVRRFHQDDSHIFCSFDQIEKEIEDCILFLQYIYNLVGFQLNFFISTRPDKFIGTIEKWDQAESSLKDALSKMNCTFEIKEGDGSFYGPKIDVEIEDLLERTHQCATIQLDFQLPQRFNLKYQSKEGNLETPVIIHRALLGSLERFIALMCENTAGKWPFWISPRHAIIIPVSNLFLDYSEEIQRELSISGDYFIDVDTSDHTLNKKIREAQLLQYNFIIIVGEKEKENKTINVRTREGVIKGEMTVNQLEDEFCELYNV